MGKPKHRLKDGLVILFEGVDGVGKTTQLHLAQEELVQNGWPVHVTRNLGGTPIGEKLREVVFSSTARSATTDLYISVAIQTALAEHINAERKKRKIILVDRGPLSLAAYHIYGNKVGPEHGWHYADEGIKLFKPDLTLLYETKLETALTRAKRRSGKSDYYANKPKAYFQRVEKGYKDAGQRYGAVHLDASKSIQEIHQQTMIVIKDLLSKPPKNQP